jgi:predicted RNase H-like nuclease (RuvC/YqgF family)
LIEDEIRRLRETIIAESEHYNKIVKDWIRKKPLYERQIQQLSNKIISLRQQIEDLIIERIGDREHAQVYNNMIKKREDEITNLEKKIADLREYDKVCKQKREQLKDTSAVLDDILSQGEISDTNLRMLVKKVTIHQNEDKSLDIRFEMNGEFNNSSSVFLDDDRLEIA